MYLPAKDPIIYPSHHNHSIPSSANKDLRISRTTLCFPQSHLLARLRQKELSVINWRNTKSICSQFLITNKHYQAPLPLQKMWRLAIWLDHTYFPRPIKHSASSPVSATKQHIWFGRSRNATSGCQLVRHIEPSYPERWTTKPATLVKRAIVSVLRRCRYPSLLSLDLMVSKMFSCWLHTSTCFQRSCYDSVFDLYVLHTRVALLIRTPQRIYRSLDNLDFVILSARLGSFNGSSISTHTQSRRCILQPPRLDLPN
jgi:hypothetical protein